MAILLKSDKNIALKVTFEIKRKVLSLLEQEK